jgi:hypothetical protein
MDTQGVNEIIDEITNLIKHLNNVISSYSLSDNLKGLDKDIFNEKNNNQNQIEEAIKSELKLIFDKSFASFEQANSSGNNIHYILELSLNQGINIEFGIKSLFETMFTEHNVVINDEIDAADMEDGLGGSIYTIDIYNN